MNANVSASLTSRAVQRSAASPTRVLAFGMVLLAAAAILAGSGCGSDETVVNRMVSPQQEQADLKRALDAGVISQSEYNEQIRKLTSRR